MVSFKDTVQGIIQEYNEINLIETTEYDGVIFELSGNRYEMISLGEHNFPIVVAVDNSDNYPHFMFSETVIGNKKWRRICLFESGTIVEYTHTEEEKIRLCLERLIQLTSLSPKEIETEYQKEFLYYWTAAVVNSVKTPKEHYQLYLDNADSFSWLEQHVYSNNTIRLTNAKRFFNDVGHFSHKIDVPVLYLPLDDIRGLFPPLKGHPWNAMTINDIMCGLQYARISENAFQAIKGLSYSKKQILLVFRIQNMYFGCMVLFANPGTAKLLVKIESQIKEVIPITVDRCDFSYLNEQIGNTIHDEHVTVIGAGSLGSYVVDELAHSGYKNITVIDDDSFEFANVFRHRSRVFGSSLPKSKLIQIEIGWMHPEIHIHAINERISANNIEKCISEDTKMVIFTVGSSDVQLQMNSAFLRDDYHIPIYYSWLEYDGKTSHVAAIRDAKKGCFECLFTDQQGGYCDNLVNRTDPKAIVYSRNGCGGTRVHYGNRTLLTASALVLDAIADETTENAIYSYYHDTMIKEPFPQNARCHCCGIR